MYQVAPSPWVVHTAKIGAEVELPDLFESTLSDRDRIWVWRLRLADEFLKVKGFSFRQRAKALGYSSTSGIEELESHFPLERCPLAVPPELRKMSKSKEEEELTLQSEESFDE